jgi:hypothetical protein
VSREKPNRCARTGKRIFRSEAAADRFLGWLWSQPQPGERLACRYYLDEVCGHIHLTSKARREEPAA